MTTDILPLELCEVAALDTYGIKLARTEVFSWPAGEIWMPHASKKFRKICAALKAQAYYVHFCGWKKDGKRFGNVDFYNNIPQSVLDRFIHRCREER